MARGIMPRDGLDVYTIEVASRPRAASDQLRGSSVQLSERSGAASLRDPFDSLRSLRLGVGLQVAVEYPTEVRSQRAETRIQK